MPYCTNCGEEVTDEQRYCSYCGEPVGEKPEGGHDHRRDASAGRDRRARQPRQQRQSRGSEARGGRAATDRRQGEWQGEPPEADLLPRRGTFETYYDGLRESVRIPITLVVSFLGWTLFWVPTLFFLAWVAVTGPIGASPVIPILFLPVSIAFGLLGIGMALYATEYQYKDEEISPKEAAKQSIGKFVPLLGVWLIFAVAFSVGFQLFILPGLYIGGRLLLAFPACVLDGEGVRDSISTSWELTRGDSLKPMGFLFSALVAIFLISLVLSIPQNLAYSAFNVGIDQVGGLFELFEMVDDPAFVAIYAVFNGLASAVPSVAVQIAATKMYLEKRYGVREELA